MSAIEIRLLGGFQVLHDGAPHRRFESQKVRALLAYLVCHRHLPQARARLADLLWPDDDPAAARRNLRQAIYNLRYALGAVDDGAPSPLLTAHQTLQFNVEVDYWLDVEAFDEAVRRGTRGDDAERARELARAAQLYRGDFLTGFHVHGSEELEGWLLGEQERLREAVIHCLRTLVQSLDQAGEYRQAIRFARQLVDRDPLAEDAHRELMRLYSLTGRRGRSLAQYEDLHDLLTRELGVEPMPETRALHRSIRERAAPEKTPEPETEPVGPFVPMVGRAGSSRALRESWCACLEGGSRLVLIEGEGGAGKTRLAKTLLHELTSGNGATVLQGRCSSSEPPVSYRPFSDVVRAAAWEDFPGEVQAAAARLTGLLPATDEVEPATESPPVERLPIERRSDRLAAALAELLAELTRPPGQPGLARSAGGDRRSPVVLFLDDLQWTGASTVELLRRLLAELADLPVWFLATWEPDLAGPEHPLQALRTAQLDGDRLDPVILPRLSADEVEEIAADLLGGGPGTPELAAFLAEHGGGVPLRIVELINLLSDEGCLETGAERRWKLAADPGLGSISVPDTLDALILRRADRLPTSARRLLELAAVVGQSFDVGALQRAADEHMGVVEIGIEMMIERWLIRQLAHDWAANPRDRDLVLWARGARRGTFEFASYRIREAIYRDLDPPRRQRMHRRVAAELDGVPVELAAHHWERAGAWREAFPLLARAAERAAGLGDRETGLVYCRRARRLLERLGTGGDDDSDDEMVPWRELDEKLEVLEKRLELAPTAG